MRPSEATVLRETDCRLPACDRGIDLGLSGPWLSVDVTSVTGVSLFVRSYTVEDATEPNISGWTGAMC
jgi:hypothetical protein